MKRAIMPRNTIKRILFYVLCSTVSQAVHASGWASSSSGFPLRSETRCEDYPMILRCPGEDVIQIVSAEYGRKTQDICSASSDQVENTDCALENAYEIVSKRCNNKTECTFQVSSEVFPDPCPGTLKYLETEFNCVRYMFNCPGTLTGVGQEISTEIDMLSQPAAWTKDPLVNVDHVFFAPVGSVVYEYASWSDFESGNSFKTYNLPYRIGGGQFVVYDRNLYFFKENSHVLLRYNLITKTVLNRAEITYFSGGHAPSQNMSLSVDESGLWVIYTRGNGAMSIKKVDKDELSVKKTWVTSRRRSDYPYTFMICGVLYAVERNSGIVDYSFNTNARRLKSRRTRLPFDNARNNFLRYDPITLSYNPREQLLYSWDASSGHAIQYKLHFDGVDPSNVLKTTRSVPKTSVTSTTTTAQKQNTPAPSTASTTTTTEPTPVLPPGQHIPVEHCASVNRGGITWPETKVGEEAKVECPSRKGEFATWRCELDSSMLKPDWRVIGPDLAMCNTWVAQIDQKVKSGLIVISTAFKSLADKVSEESELNVPVPEITGLVDNLLEHATVPSQEEAKSMVESIASISTRILSDEGAMSSLSDEVKSSVAMSLMNATEKASFLYAETVAQTPPEMRKPGSDSVIIATEEILTEINVIEKRLNKSELTGMTLFPDDKTCSKAGDNCGEDVIEIPTADIMTEGVPGPAIVLFALYKNLSEYLDASSRSEWEIDSRVISATIQEQNTRTSLTNPAIITLRHKHPSSAERRCVFWDFQASDGNGNWSQKGCTSLPSNRTHTICKCDHLTSFAVLVNHAGVELNAEEETALSIITKLGIVISIVCLVLCVATFSYFRNLHSDRNSVHRNLCICILVAETVFLFGIDQYGNHAACAVIAGILHYFFLAAFMWMAVEGFMLYVMLVEVFETESRWKWYYLFGYGVPAVIVGISAAVDHEGYGSEKVCWLRFDTGFIWSFVGPVIAIILANLAFLSIAVYKMYVHTVAFADVSKLNSIKASIRGASVLLCLLGITWAFGVLWISENSAILAYLFCIFNAFQGMFIFIFHCLLPRNVRQEYKRLFKRLPCCEKIGQRSYLSNSSSFSKKFTPGRYPLGSGVTVNVTLQDSHIRRMWNETIAPKNSDDVTNNDVARNGETSHNAVSLNHTRLQFAADRNYLREDEVFLPSQNATRENLQYDRLQHHYHPDDYLIFPGEARPLGDFGTGKIPQRDHLGHVIQSEHQTPRMGVRTFAHTPTVQPNVQDGSRARNIIQNPRLFRRSLDENCNAKRDSGISLQRHPSVSGTSSHQYRRSMDNVLDLQGNGSDACFNGGLVRSNRAHRLSLDSVSRPRTSSASYRSPPSTRAVQSQKRATLQPKSILDANKKRTSLSSDSDDPIVTDCSVSSACSSNGNKISRTNACNNNNNYQYEEPICRKTERDVTKHRLQGHQCRLDQSDENDFEVERITNSDNSLDPRHDTLGYPPYRPPTPPTSNNQPLAAPRSRLTQRNDSYEMYQPRDFPTRPRRVGVLHQHAVPRTFTGR